MKYFLSLSLALLCHLLTFSKLPAETLLRNDGLTAETSHLPTLTLDKQEYAPGETITATFSNGLGNSADWIGIYPKGITPSGTPPSLLWFYTNGTRTQDGNLTDGTVKFTNISLNPGEYRAWFLQNGGYFQLANPIDFTVHLNTPPTWRVDTVKLIHAVTQKPYTASIRPYASGGSALRFEKIDGPAWLTVSEEGTLSGTPAEADAGLNTFTIRVAHKENSPHADVPLEIQVFPTDQENINHLSVMSYNTWHNWTQVNGGFQKGIESIVQSDADVIGFQESNETHAINTAAALGWHRADVGNGSSQIISRYPITETYTIGIATGARIRIAQQPQRDVIIFNCHLDYQFYTPYIAENKNATAADLLAEDARSQRLPQITTILSGMETHLNNADQVPVFFTGDFNGPSHLDWTAETTSLHNSVGPVTFPVSLAIENAGFLDSFRIAHPDPFTTPGNTWSTIHKETEPQDRIDFVFHKGSPLKVISSKIYHTEVQKATGRWGASITPVLNNTWPSDHAGVITTYSFAAADSE